jgi:hypothetical protein
MLWAIRLSVVMLRVVMLSFVMLSVIMLSFANPLVILKKVCMMIDSNMNS